MNKTITDCIKQIQDKFCQLEKEKEGQIVLLSSTNEDNIIETLGVLKTEGIKSISGDKLDFEFMDIDGATLTFEDARMIPSPAGKDGGIIIVHNLVEFIAAVKEPEQGNAISRLVGDMFNEPTGWNAILVAVGANENIWMTSDCCRYNAMSYISLPSV